MRTRPLSQRQRIKLLERLGESARAVAYQYGLNQLDLAAVKAMTAACRTAVVYVHGDALSRPIPNEDGSFVLYVSAHAPAEVQRHVILEHCARVWPGLGCRDRVVATAFALWGAFHRAGCFSAEGSAWAGALSRVLRSHPRLFAHVRFNLALDLVDAVHARASRSGAEDVEAAAQRAFEYARAKRIGQEYAEAEALYLRAHRIAARADLADLATVSLRGAGQCAMLRGSLPRSDGHFFRAVRYATHHERREQRALALHDWFVLHVEYGNDQRADQLAAEAEAAYPPSLPSHRLAHDTGWFYLRSGDYTNALPLLRDALLKFDCARDRLLAWGNVARAAAGSGLADEYEEACSAVGELIDGADDEGKTAVPLCLLSLAYGAASLGMVPRAEGEAKRALAAATAGRLHKHAFEAEALLHALAREPQEIQRDTKEQRADRREVVANLRARLARA